MRDKKLSCAADFSKKAKCLKKTTNRLIVFAPALIDDISLIGVGVCFMRHKKFSWAADFFH
jgi:hypothetical protein